MRHIGIIGGGLAGLTVAFRRQLAGDAVSVFEAGERLGGQLVTERAGGFVIEHGAEGFVAGSRVVAELAATLGIGHRIIGQEVSDSCVFEGQALRRLSPGEAGRMLGFQVSERALGKGIEAFAGGMQEVIERLYAELGAERCSAGTPIGSVRPDGSRWQLLRTSGERHAFDEVVVATSARAAGSLLSEAFGAAAAALADSEATSSVTVSLAYPRSAVRHALDATGFVVAGPAQDEGFRACTFVSSKLRGRAPADRALLRLFFRPTPAELAALDDAAWAARAERSVARALAVAGPPERAWVSRWANALPVFDPAHRARVAALEQQLQGSGVRLAGAAFHGSGIEGAVRSAEAAAQALAEPNRKPK